MIIHLYICMYKCNIYILTLPYPPHPQLFSFQRTHLPLFTLLEMFQRTPELRPQSLCFATPLRSPRKSLKGEDTHPPTPNSEISTQDTFLSQRKTWCQFPQIVSFMMRFVLKCLVPTGAPPKVMDSS